MWGLTMKCYWWIWVRVIFSDLHIQNYGVKQLLLCRSVKMYFIDLCPPSLSSFPPSLLFEAFRPLPTLCISSTVNWLSLISLTVSSPASSSLLLFLPQSPAGWSPSAGGMERRWKGKIKPSRGREGDRHEGPIAGLTPRGHGSGDYFPNNRHHHGSLSSKPQIFGKWVQNMLWGTNAGGENNSDSNKCLMLQAETMADGDSREEKLKEHCEGNFHIIN